VKSMILGLDVRRAEKRIFELIAEQPRSIRDSWRRFAIEQGVEV